MHAERRQGTDLARTPNLIQKTCVLPTREAHQGSARKGRRSQAPILPPEPKAAKENRQERRQVARRNCRRTYWSGSDLDAAGGAAGRGRRSPVWFLRVDSPALGVRDGARGGGGGGGGGGGSVKWCRPALCAPTGRRPKSGGPASPVSRLCVASLSKKPKSCASLTS